MSNTINIKFEKDFGSYTLMDEKLWYSARLYLFFVSSVYSYDIPNRIKILVRMVNGITGLFWKGVQYENTK